MTSVHITRPTRRATGAASRITRRGFLGVGVLLVAGLALVGCTPETQVTVAQPEQSGISVDGSGTAMVRPDIARLDVGVEVTAPTVAEARGDAATAMEQLQEALSASGVADEDIQTQFFNIYPQYNYPDDRGAPTVTGYSVSNQVQVTVRDIDAASDVLDAAIQAGGDAVRVNGINFTVEDPEQYLAEAREEAVEQARARAEVLAEAAGVTLGGARAVSESGGGMPSPAFQREAAADSGGATPISPGEQELRVTVQVTYDIER